MQTKNKNKGGRPALSPTKKRKNRVQFYLSDDELKNLESLKIGIVRYSPTLTLSEFFRIVVNNYDETIIDYLQEPYDSEVKQHMRSKCAYNKIFKG